jgi:multiple sugar transport system ATP-binding protein
MTLGDRVVVMKGGVIQQCGAPLEVYNLPVNRFVAGFVGMPPMNFLEGTILADAGRLWFDEGTGRIAVPDWAEGALAGAAGAAMTMGVRPHAIHEASRTGGAGDSTLELKVDVVELLGDKMDVHMSTPRHSGIVAHVDAHGRLAPGQKAPMRFDPDRLQFFRPGPMGARIAADPRPKQSSRRDETW